LVIFGTTETWSSSILGIADNKIVIDTKMESEPISSQEVKEEIGGKLKSFHKLAKHLRRYMHRRREIREGGAVSAGAMSAGGMHSRSKHHKLKHLIC